MKFSSTLLDIAFRSGPTVQTAGNVTKWTVWHFIIAVCSFLERTVVGAGARKSVCSVKQPEKESFYPIPIQIKLSQSAFINFLHLTGLY